MDDIDNKYMEIALNLAIEAFQKDEVPVGAVILQNGRIIGKGSNSSISLNDPTAHAEILAIRDAASSIGNYRLPDTTIYVTLEPCAMCAGAIIWSRIERVVIGARDTKAGAAGSVLSIIPNQKLNHRPEVIFGIEEQKCSEILSRFFIEKRDEDNKL